MSDPRINPDPALVRLDDPAQIIVPVADIMRNPNGPRDRQILYGDRVTLLNRTSDWSLIRSSKDGYCGWVPASVLGPQTPRTHRVTSRATIVFSEADFKSPEEMTLSVGSSLNAIGETNAFVETSQGFVPRQHVQPFDITGADPTAVAELFLGTPYLWGGNSSFGIDCSGLVQAACLACGIPCAGDTDQQQNTLGHALTLDAQLRRNDVIFWKGHVALVADAQTILHANAGHMATVFEPLADAVDRIEQQGDGRPTAFRRLF